MWKVVKLKCCKNISLYKEKKEARKFALLGAALYDRCMEDISLGRMPDFFTKEKGAPTCAETAPDIFFIDSDDGATPAEVYAGRKIAKQICASCPYQVECAEWAIDKGETLGIWGGLTPRERSDIRRARSRGQVVIISELRVFNPDKTTKKNRTGAGKKRATASLGD